MNSKSLQLTKKFLGKKVKIKIDRPIGSRHPKWGFKYSVNYGFLEGVKAPDGENLDAYLLNIDIPVNKYEGRVVAIIHRTNDDDDKLVVIPEGESITDEEINKAVNFQEKWFKYKIVRI